MVVINERNALFIIRGRFVKLGENYVSKANRVHDALLGAQMYALARQLATCFPLLKVHKTPKQYHT